jgi:hypothetical protein
MSLVTTDAEHAITPAPDSALSEGLNATAARRCPSPISTTTVASIRCSLVEIAGELA